MHDLSCNRRRSTGGIASVNLLSIVCRTAVRIVGCGLFVIELLNCTGKIQKHTAASLNMELDIDSKCIINNYLSGG